MNGDIDKNTLYENVKLLVDMESEPHLHLNQHKLFTLFSFAFQYLLFRSSKKPGAYIIRIQDSALAQKLSKRSKDSSTRKFMNSLMVPRKLKFGPSWFYLDFFHIGSWNLTKDIPPSKLQAALIVKNTSTGPFDELPLIDDGPEAANGQWNAGIELPEDYYLTCLKEACPKTLTIAFDEIFDGIKPVHFPSIKKEVNRTISGVTISDEIDWDEIE